MTTDRLDALASRIEAPTPDWAFDPMSHTKMEAEPSHVVGMIDFSARMAIRDLIRVHGFEDARELIAMYLDDENRRPRRV